MSGILQLINTFPSGGFAVKNSLRFRSSASAYLNRTPSVAGNQTTWTWSGWIKKGNLTVFEHLFGAASSVSNRFSFNFDNSVASGTNGDYLCAFIVLGGTLTNLFQTNALFRDPSSWYHIVLAVDTTQATSTNRLKLYVNGVQQTFSTYSAPAQNTAMLVNSAIAHNIASGAYSAGTFTFDGYMAEVNFIDGQALTPSSFGAFDATSGVWQPTRYSGTYGTNGFYLKFSDTTSTTTLCYDYSGNSNNWTPNNISLTAGSTYDSMLDSPTNYDNGGNGVGNYAVLNPLYAYSNLTLSGANLNIASSANYRSGVASFGMSSGKWYWEYVVTGVGNDTVLGISSNPSVTIATYTGGDALSWGYEALSGNKYNNTSFSAYGAAYTANDVIGIAFDANTGSLTFYKNGVSQGVAYSGLVSGTYYAAFGLGNSSTGSINFGQRPFAYTPPTGYKTLCTQNLPVATIYNGANHMAATTYTGTGSSLSISNSVNSASFQPDFVWIKSRSAATDHALYDVIRGTQNRLESNTTDAAVASDNGLTAFGSAGFTVNTLAQVNTSAATYVGWQWKAGGTAVTNTAGSITSSVSANTTAGFSVVTYTGTGANATVGHGLGVAPSMVIIKARVSANLWVVYHASLGASGYVSLNSTAAFASLSTVFNNTTPTSSVFSIGAASGTNDTNGMVAYCFAAIPGYSAFGSYTGNGSTDGPFVFLGFRPRYVLVKATSSAENWFTWDTSRDPYNVASNDLYPNLSNAESAAPPRLDFLSNGFKCRASAANPNLNGVTYIYAAFAENPFKYSLAR